MEQIVLNVEARQPGRTIAKALRRAGSVPGIFYSNGENAIPFTAKKNDLKKIVFTSETRIINLNLPNKTEPVEAVLKFTDFDPVTDEIVHIDLYGIIRGQKMIVEVPINLEGTPIGVLTYGGILQQQIYKVKINVLPKDIPSQLTKNISHLNVGDSLSLKDFASELWDFSIPLDSVVASVASNRLATKALDEEVPAAEKPTKK